MNQLCCLGGIRTLHPSPVFSTGILPLNYKTSFCLEVIASPPYSTTPGLPWTAIVDFKTQGTSNHHYKSLQNLSQPGYDYYLLSVLLPGHS